MSTKLLRFLPRFFRGNKDKEKLSGHNKYCQYVEDGIKAGDYICRVILLDDKETNLAVKPSARANCLLRKVFDHVNLLERDYFGLRFLDQNNQSHWMDSNKTISAQLKGSTSFTLYFVVKFYAADPCKLREEITRYYFFLQIKRDIYDGRLPVTFEEIIELGAYVLQSELGDYNPKLHTEGYVSEFRFIQHQSIEHEQAIAVLHRRLVGQVPAVAEYRFLEKAKWLEMYGVDLHPVKGESNMEYMLGITPAGIILHKNKNKVGNYFWPRITKVRFKDKIFSIKVKDRNCDEHWYAFESGNKVACKHLWRCCVEHHAFFSGRTERMMKENQRFRDQPEVIRVASKKHQRRSHSDPKISVSCYSDQVSKLPLSITISPEAIRMPRLRSLPELPGKDSPRSTRSYPWESSSAGGLYTSGKDSPMSTKSDKLKFQVQRRAISGSDSEQNYKKRKEMTSNSDSDVSCRRPPLYPSRGGISSGDNSRPSTVREDTVSPSHSSTTVGGGVGATADGLQKRRRRRRSKSPNRRPPEELKNHFVYNLIETEDWPEDQLREIPYTKVETKSQPFRIKHSPKSKHYAKSRSRSCGDKISSRNPQIHGVEEEEEGEEGETNDGNLSPYNRHSKETSPPPPAYSSLNEPPVSIRKDQVKMSGNYRYQTSETIEPSPTITQDPAMSHKISTSSSRHTRPTTIGTPESRRPRSHNEHVTRISYCSEPGADSDTPRHHSSRLGTESDTPGHHSSRRVESDTPRHHSSRLGTESDTPGHHSSRRVESDTRRHHSSRLGTESDTPGHHSHRRVESDTPRHHSSRLGTESDTPGHHSSRRVENDTPRHHSSRLGTESDTPGHHSSRRVESDTRRHHSSRLGTESDTPGHHSSRRVESDTPRHHSSRLETENDTPGHHSSRHGTESDTPGHHSSRLGTESDTPGHHSSRHGTESDTPGHHSIRLGTESDTPGHHSSRLGTESDTPEHHSSRHGTESDRAGQRHERSSNWQSPTAADSPNAGSYTPVHTGRRTYNQNEDSDHGSYTPVHRSRQTHHYSRTEDRPPEPGGNHRPPYRSRHSDGRSANNSSSSHSHQHRSGSHGEREGHSRSRPTSHVDREGHSSSRSRHSRTPEDNDPGRPSMNKDSNLTVVFHEGQTNEEATEL